MKTNRTSEKQDKKTIKENRTFPTEKVILLIVTLLIQIGILFGAFRFEPKPKDIIHQYDVTVTARENGSLDIHYRFVWEAVDTSEELTWIEIGMANENFSVYPGTVSDTIRQYMPQAYDGEVYLVLDLDRGYSGGEVLEFSFKVNQKDMLCQDSDGYFYEFVPGWFNAIPVENYTFRWAEDGKIQSISGGKRQDGYFTWNGSFDCGGYEKMTVRYGQDSFAGCSTVPYQSFDGNGAHNELDSERTSVIIMAFIVAICLLFLQIWTVDSVVSYHRGRGFLTSYGHHIHVFGMSNPHYVQARDREYAKRARRASGYHGTGRGGGCACACACACAGGGRAGCSQKDTYSHIAEQD